MKYTVKLGRNVVAAFATVGMLFTAANGATTINLQGLPGNFQQSPWNGGLTRIYAQSIQTPTIDRTLSTIVFNIVGSSNVNFDLIISGTRSNAGGLRLAPNYSDIRWQQSYTVATNSTVSASPNITFTSTETFFVSLVAQTTAGGNYTVESTQYQGTEQYVPGEFVYLNASYSDALTSSAINNAEWDHRLSENQDLAFRAEFTAIPEPSSVMLLGLGALGVMARRRRIN